MADLIDNLPTDPAPLTANETNLLNMLNGNRTSPNNINVQEVQKTADNINRVFWGLKDVIIASILFAVFSLPYTDKIINTLGGSVINIESTWKRLGIKMIAFAIILFCILNFNLARK